MEMILVILFGDKTMVNSWKLCRINRIMDSVIYCGINSCIINFYYLASFNYCPLKVRPHKQK